VEAGAILERLPLKTALQLLLEAQGSTRSVFTRARPKVLAALTEYQGGEQVVQTLRQLLALDYSGHNVGAFVELLADLRPALSGTTASSTSRDVLDAAAAVGLWPLPNAFVAAVLQVLGPLHAGQAATPSWAQQATALLCAVARQAPAASSARLAEAVAVSLVHGSTQHKQWPDATAAATGTEAWQDSMAALLVALPAAASSTSEWAPLAASVCAAAAEAAGSQAVLQVISGVFRPSTLSPADAAVRTAWAAQVMPLLARLQHQGLLTCGLAWSASGSSVCSHPAAAAPASTATPSCISMQLLHLLQQLYQTDKAFHLQQAAGAIVALAPSLGKALPMAVAMVLSGGLGAGARGYGTAGPDTAAAEAALQAATAEVSSALRPTGAAVPAATTVAAKQLSEALAVCHEMLPEAVMTQLMAALAAVLPWSEVGSSGSGSKCPAEQEMAQGGWQGVTQLLLISSSLLTASCKVWGVDKGTHIAASLIEKLVAAGGTPGAAPAATEASGMEASGDRRLRRSSSDSAQHAQGAERVLRRAASMGSSSSGVQAAKARAALLQAAGASSSGSQAAAAGAVLLKAAASTPAARGSHAARAEASLLHAAVRDGRTVAGSQASSAEAALLHAAASGLDAAGSVASQAARAQQALTRAMTTGSSTTTTTSAAAERVAWATEQLLAAMDAWFWPGLTTSKALVQGMIHPAYHSSGLADEHAASSSSGARYALAAAKGRGSLDAVLRPEEAAAALLAALPRLASELPADLTAQVLAQSWGLVASADWAAGLEHVAAVSAESQLLELLKVVAELPAQLDSSMALPQACTEVLFSAAARCSSSAQQELLGQMLGFLQPASAAQLLLELARPRTAEASSSNAQLQLLGVAAPVVLRHIQEDGSSSSETAIGQLASTLYQAAVVPRAFLTLLLMSRPHLDSAQLDTAVRQLGLATGDTAAATTALAELCSSREGPGWQLPLAAFADVLAVALQQAKSADFARVSMPEARQGLEADRRRCQQQLLTAVVAVLGSFRGMRRTHTSPLGAQLVLPMHDLAAVLCYAWELMPKETSARLAAAVAGALADSQGNQLQTLLALLPNAAAEGFRKGRELWQPLLHCMAVAGGLSGLQEARLSAKLLRLEADQRLVSHPVTVAPADGSIRFADPAAVTAALAPAAANNAAARGVRLPSASSSSSSIAVQAGSGNIDSAGADQAATGTGDSEALALVSTASLAGVYSLCCGMCAGIVQLGQLVLNTRVLGFA
jgi:hypothetical protein